MSGHKGRPAVMQPQGFDGYGDFRKRADTRERTEVLKMARQEQEAWNARADERMRQALRARASNEARAALRFAIAASFYADAFADFIVRIPGMGTDREVSDAFDSIPKQGREHAESPEEKTLIDQKQSIFEDYIAFDRYMQQKNAMTLSRGTLAELSDSVDAFIAERLAIGSSLSLAKRRLIDHWRAEEEKAHRLYCTAAPDLYTLASAAAGADVVLEHAILGDSVEGFIAKRLGVRDLEADGLPHEFAGCFREGTRSSLDALEIAAAGVDVSVEVDKIAVIQDHGLGQISGTIDGHAFRGTLSRG